MLEGDDFISAGKDYLVLADYRAAAYRVHTYLGLASLCAYRVTIVNVLAFLLEHFVDSVAEHDSCAAGGVDLLIMMFLDYLNIELTFENSRRLFGKFSKKIDAKRHIEVKNTGINSAAFFILAICSSL